MMAAATGAAIVGASVIGGYMSAQAQKSAASTAAKAQTAAAGTAAEAQLESTKLAIQSQEKQLAEARELLSPFVKAGESALTDQLALAGLSGPEAQQAVIANIEQSPYFQAIAQQGEEAMLQQASATGGLRGGNIQAALAQYRPQLLQQQIENQYSKLGGLTNIGQASAAGTAAAGAGAASNISSLYGQQGAALSNLAQQTGAAQAGSALAAGQAQAQMYGNISGSIGQLGTLKLLGAF